MFRCHRCLADPQPDGFDSPRRCAFLENGQFTPDNWNCATISALIDRERDACGDRDVDHYGNDESMQIICYTHTEGTDGFIVFNRYKQRGCTSSAMHVGDFWPARPLTLSLAEAVLAKTPLAPGDDVPPTEITWNTEPFEDDPRTNLEQYLVTYLFTFKEVARKIPSVTIAYRLHGKWESNSPLEEIKDVIAWAPLPAPYTEEEGR
jgi:hypothetical protein